MAGRSANRLSRLLKLRSVLSFVVLLALLGSLLGYLVSMWNTNATFPSKPFIAAYEWRFSVATEDPHLAATFHNLKQEGITVVYLDISQYADYLDSDQPREKEKAEFQQKMSRYIEVANKEGITVEAVAGSPIWGASSHWYVAEGLLRFFDEYNANTSFKLAGLQFDIEPYNLPEYSHNSEHILKEYVALVDRLVEMAEKSAPIRKGGVRFGFAVPFWLDNDTGNAPAIEWKGKSAYAVYHILDRLTSLPGSYLAVMDYRNFTEGEDGSIAHIQNELAYIKDNSLGVKMVVAQETTEVEPKKITFHGKRKSALKKAITEIASTYEGSAIVGFAVNDLEGYRSLR